MSRLLHRRCGDWMYDVYTEDNVCVCVCVFVCVCVCVCVWICIRMYVWIYVYMYISVDRKTSTAVVLHSGKRWCISSFSRVHIYIYM